MSERFSGNWFFTDFLQSVLFQSLGFFQCGSAFRAHPHWEERKGKPDLSPAPHTVGSFFMTHLPKPFSSLRPMMENGAAPRGLGDAVLGARGGGSPRWVLPHVSLLLLLPVCQLQLLRLPEG